MALDDDIKEIKKGIETIGNNQQGIYKFPSRYGLYLMIGITMIAGMKSCNRTADIKENMQAIPQIQEQNVISQEAPEKFYEINGQRVYLEVDGKPIEQYFKE